MIDVLPTILDLVELPQPNVLQGQSLGPLLRGRPGWRPRPVILDEVRADAATGQLRGRMEVIDGRWGASSGIGPPSGETRPWPVLLYEVWADPWALRPLNEQHPDLVKKYTKFLEDTWKDHQLWRNGSSLVHRPRSRLNSSSGCGRWGTSGSRNSNRDRTRGHYLDGRSEQSAVERARLSRCAAR